MKAKVTTKHNLNLIPAYKMESGDVGFIRTTPVNVYAGLLVMRVGNILFDLNDGTRYWSSVVKDSPAFEIELLPSYSVVELTVNEEN